MAEKKPTAPSDEAVLDAQYRVLSGGITSQTGRPVTTHYKGEIVQGRDLGDAGRVRALLSRGAIEVVTDGTD